jgi:DNA-directed RNA polymerase subunit RPC12/RpoP
MLAAGTVLMASCEKCGAYRYLDVGHMVEVFGEEADIWDRWAVCPACGGRVFFIASTSRSTPARPCITSGDPNHWSEKPMEGVEFIRSV